MWLGVMIIISLIFTIHRGNNRFGHSHSDQSHALEICLIHTKENIFY